MSIPPKWIRRRSRGALSLGCVGSSARGTTELTCSKKHRQRRLSRQLLLVAGAMSCAGLITSGPVQAAWSTKDYDDVGEYSAVARAEQGTVEMHISCTWDYPGYLGVTIFTTDTYDPGTSYSDEVPISVVADGVQQPVAYGAFEDQRGRAAACSRLYRWHGRLQRRPIVPVERDFMAGHRRQDMAEDDRGPSAKGPRDLEALVDFDAVGCLTNLISAKSALGQKRTERSRVEMPSHSERAGFGSAAPSASRALQADQRRRQTGSARHLSSFCRRDQHRGQDEAQAFQ